MPAESSRAVFLSYASQDAVAARRICDALRAAGVEVWFDQSELRGGDAWDQKIRQQIKECALFVPIISANTQARAEGYFRLEWKLADRRTDLIGKSKAFLLPVCIDDTRDGDADVPDSFVAVQWVRLRDGEANAAFCARVKTLLGAAVEPSASPAPARTTDASPAPAASRGRRSPVGWIAAGAVLVAAVVSAIVLRPAKAPADPKPPEPAVKSSAQNAPPPASATTPPQNARAQSLVVLPLENLSPDPANGYFADGVHAEIITAITRTTDLRVISRTSSLALRETKEPLPALAKRVGADNVITGSVRREGDTLRIQLELRRASDEAMLWNKNYDPPANKVLSVQTEIASEVARLLQAREFKGSVRSDAGWTQNPRVYELYLKSLESFSARLETTGLSAIDESIRLLEEAVRLDPGFLPAVDALAARHVIAGIRTTDLEQRYHYYTEARRWAEATVKLVPGGGGDSAASYYYTRVANDPVRGLALADNAIRTFPNDSLAHNRRGLALVELGRTREGIEEFRQARVLDPLNGTIWQNECVYLARMRRRAEWTQLLDSYGRSGLSGMGTNSAVVRARFALEGSISEQGTAGYWRARKYPEVVRAAKVALARSDLRDLTRLPIHLRKCNALRRLNQPEELAAAVAELRAFVEKLNAIPTTDPSERQIRIAEVAAFAGQADVAVQAGRRFVAGANPSHLAMRWTREIQLAEIYCFLGRKQECLDLLEKLLRVPSGLTVPMLKVSPEWDPLREDLRFQALLADPKNDEPLN